MPRQASTTPAVPVPRTEAELRAVVLHRNELASQLEQLSVARNTLLSERMTSIATQAPASTVAELDARIKALGERVVRIERQKLAADDAVAAATASGVGTQEPGVPSPDAPPLADVSIPGFPSPDFVTTAIQEARQEMRAEYERMAIVTGAGLLLLGVLAWRWAWRRAVARLRRELAAEAPAAGGQRELRDAVDAIALEVERISENQRFVTKLLGERIPASAQRDDASPR